MESISDLDINFFISDIFYMAGDPMDEKVRCTHLTRQQISDKLKEKGIDVSRKIVTQFFKKLGYVKRKAQKVIGIGTCEYRNEQFEIITRLRAEYQVLKLKC